MNLFKVNIIAVNPAAPERSTLPVEVLVDTGSELTWLPSDILSAIGVSPKRKRNFLTATKQTVQRNVGYAIVRAEGYETIDEVVFAERGDMNLLGVRTIDGFGAMADNIANRFIGTTTLAV